MIDPTPNEAEAMTVGGQQGGEYLESIGKSDLATLTETAAWLRTRAAQADHPWSAPLAIEALLQRTRSALDARSRPL